MNNNDIQSFSQYRAFFLIELLVSVSIILLIFTMLHIYYAQSSRLLAQAEQTHKALSIASSHMERALASSRRKASPKCAPHDSNYAITTEHKKHQDLLWITVNVSWQSNGKMRNVKLSSAGY